jgi:RNA polymerase sigma-70 factor (ECF subfamily)
MRQALIERARRGDKDAFGQLAAEEIDHLHAIARLVLHDPQLAEDAVQETLIRCWRKLPALREVEKFDAWLYRILVRAVTDQVSSRRRFEVNVQNLRLEPNVSDQTHMIADRDELEQGFRTLSVEHRTVIVLHHYADLPMTEVADALGIRLGTAKSRYHYAMTALRASMESGKRLTVAEGARA